MRASQLDSWRVHRYGVEDRTNVGNSERVWSGIVGGLLVVIGIQRRGVLGAIAALGGAGLIQRAATGHCPVYDALGLTTAHNWRGRAQPRDYFQRGIHVEESVTIQRPLQEVYDFWRSFENLPRFMEHVKSVHVLNDRRSHWVVKGPTGRDVEWDAQIINEEPGRLISWKSLEGAEVDNAGTVSFRKAVGGRGTEVRVTLEYLPPAGRLGVTIAKVMGESPGQQVRDDLRRLRELLETGEEPTTRGQPTGRHVRGAGTPIDRTRPFGRVQHLYGGRGAQRAREADFEQERLQVFESEGGPPFSPPSQGNLVTEEEGEE